MKKHFTLIKKIFISLTIVISSAHASQYVPGGYLGVGEINRVAPGGRIGNEIIFELRNYSNVALSDFVTDVQALVIVNSRPVKIIPLSALTDLSTLKVPHGLITVRTGIRVSGKKNVSVILLSNKYSDENKYQHSRHRRINYTNFPGHDLSLTGFYVNDQNRPVIDITNLGTPIRQKRSAIIELAEQEIPGIGTPVNFQSVQILIPPLRTGAMASIKLPAGTIVKQGSWHWAKLKPVPTRSSRIQLLNTETDLSNNIISVLMTSPDPLEKYRSILSDTEITQAIQMEFSILANGVAPLLSYPSWPSFAQNELLATIVRLERGQSTGLESEPVLDNEFHYSFIDAKKIYFARVAQSLWAEVNHALPWSLKDFPLDMRSMVLASPSIQTRYNKQGTSPTYYPAMEILHNATIVNPRDDYFFMKYNGLIKRDRRSTILAFTDWARGHLEHGLFRSGNRTEYFNIWGYQGFPSSQLTIYAKQGEPGYTLGCGGMSGVYNAMLATLNIPVRAVRPGEDPESGVHIRTQFPSEDMALYHADMLYENRPDRSLENPESQDLFVTLSELNQIPLMTKELRSAYSACALNCAGTGGSCPDGSKTTDEMAACIRVDPSCFMANGGNDQAKIALADQSLRVDFQHDYLYHKFLLEKGIAGKWDSLAYESADSISQGARTPSFKFESLTYRNRCLRYSGIYPTQYLTPSQASQAASDMLSHAKDFSTSTSSDLQIRMTSAKSNLYSAKIRTGCAKTGGCP